MTNFLNFKTKLFIIQEWLNITIYLWLNIKLLSSFPLFFYFLKLNAKAHVLHSIKDKVFKIKQK